MQTQDLSHHIAQITALPVRSFEHEISLLPDPFLAVPYLAQVLWSSLPTQHKLTAASGINLIYLTALREHFRQWPRWWDHFSEAVLLQAEQIGWRYLSILSKSTQGFMNQFQAEFCQILNPLFDRLSFKSRLLLYDAFLYVEVTSETRFVFLRQTVELFLTDVLGYLCWAHERPESRREQTELQKDAMSTLKLLLTKLEGLYNDHYVDELMQSLSLNHDLFCIILEQLLFDPEKLSYLSLQKEQFSPERLSELVLVSRAQGPLRETVNHNKAEALRVFQAVLGRFDKKSMVEEFDRYKQLYLMQKLSPLVATVLAESAKSKDIDDDDIEVLHALIDWLAYSSRFNFQLHFFEDRYQDLLFEVCYPLIAANAEQIENYRENGQQFIKITEELVQNHEDKTKSLRSAAVDLLEAMVAVLNGSLTTLVDLNIRAIRFLLTGDPDLSFLQIKEKYHFQFTVEVALTVLSVFSDQYVGRGDLIERIRRGLLELPELDRLEEMNLAKLFLFLSYNYESCYLGREAEASHLLRRAANCLENESTLSDCAFFLFENCIGLGFQLEIWGLLLDKITTSKSTYFLQLMQKVVREKIADLSPDVVKELSEKTIEKLIGEYKSCAVPPQGSRIAGSPSLFGCLNLLQEISSQTLYLQQNQLLVDAIWPVFDMFEFVDQIEFEDNIVAIFRRILTASNHLTARHFSFVEALPAIYRKIGRLDPELLNIFSCFLTRGRQNFLLEARHGDLLRILSCLKECYGEVKEEKTLTYICILYQFAYREYTDILAKDQQLLQTIMLFYNQKKERLREETIASIINLLITIEACYGNAPHNIIRENNISIFKGYQAQIAAQCFRKMIQKYYNQELAGEYLRYSIRLLHFLKSTAHIRHCYYSLPYAGVQTLDPFEETCKALNFLKAQLPPSEYDELIESLKEQISLGEVRDLLTRRIVSKNLRSYVRVKVAPTH